MPALWSVKLICLFLTVIICVCSSSITAQDLQFTLVADGLSWLQRENAQLHTVQQSINYTYQGSSLSLPVGSFILYGGWRITYNLNVNDLWISTDQGRSWNFINDTGRSSFPVVPGCTWCSDSRKDRLYAISRFPFRNMSIWTSTTRSLNNWTSIEPQIISNSTNITSPFLDRYGANCLVDGNSNVYYFLGMNLSSPVLGPSKLSNDTWKSVDRGYHWTKQTNHIPFAGRYLAMTGVHLNNSHLDGVDVLYVLGGATRGPDGYERLLNDIWVSSDGSVSWSPIDIKIPWGVNQMLTSEFSLYITRDGILILSTVDVNGNPTWYSQIWSSFDGGSTWSLCLDRPPYGEINPA